MRRETDVKFPFEVYSKCADGVVIPAHYNENKMEIAEIVSGSAVIQRM